MGAEAPIFNVATPMDIHSLGPLLKRTDAVPPMIIVGVTASGPSQNRYTKFAEVIHCLLAVAVDVGNWRFLADPQTTVDTRAEMLGKMTMKFGANEGNLCASADHKLLRG